MRLTRCYIDTPLQIGALVSLPESISVHLTRVLRLGLGARLVLFNGDGYDYEAELASLGKRGAGAEVISMRQVASESPLRLVLAQAVARGEKMDFVLQKATELGAAGFVPLVTERTEVRLDAERGEKRRTHWQGVIASACEQSGRAQLPELAAVATLTDWLARRTSAAEATSASDSTIIDLRFPLFYLDPEAELSLCELPVDARTRACFVIGPEGGLGDHDLAHLRAADATGLRLGPRVLRTETAGLALLAAMQAMYGDFQGKSAQVAPSEVAQTIRPRAANPPR
ncbi:16S rRNA (uracil(1498)-N(3))-methyltransferase [Xanthomonadaceae bacterium JHOS43]|nr:16S rRNA (uracil(1498)-N(3))-methyltransferase [Xanthomonadaceae bacterium JHOS43]